MIDYSEDRYKALIISCKIISCLSIVSIPFYCTPEDREPGAIQLIGANINNAIINTAIFGGVTFALLNKYSTFSKEKALKISFGSLAVISVLVGIGFSIIFLKDRISDADLSYLDITCDLSSLNPIGLLTNAVVKTICDTVNQH